MPAPLDFASSYLLAIQAAVVGRLQSSARIPDTIPVLGKVDGSLETAIDLALAGVGSTIFVSPVVPGGVSADVPAVLFDRGDFIVSIFQDGATDDSGRTAHLLMEIVMGRLQQWTPAVDGAGCITLDPDPVNGSRSTKKRTILDVGFSLSGGFDLDHS